MPTSIKHSPSGPRIVGMGAERDFTVSLQTGNYTYPTMRLEVERPDSVRVMEFQSYTTTSELTVVLGGNLTGLKLSMTTLAPDDTPRNDAQLLPDRHIQAFSSIGRCRVRVETEYGTREVTGSYNVPEGGLYDRRTYAGLSFKTNTLAGHIWAVMQEYLPDESSNEANCQFLPGGVYDYQSVSCTDNPTFRFKGIDWSGITLRREGALADGWQYPAALISPRHVAYAKHSGFGAGSWVTFRTPAGAYINAQVLSVREATPANTGVDDTVDLKIAYLDREITGCKTFKVLPSDWKRFLPSAVAWDAGLSLGGRVVTGLPLLVRFGNLGSPAEGSHRYVTWRSPNFMVNLLAYIEETGRQYLCQGDDPVPEDPKLLNNYREAYGGDSSSPEFLLIRERDSDAHPEPVLMAFFHFARGGACLASWADWIQTQMDVLAVEQGHQPVHQLQRVDLSRFLRFPSNATKQGTVTVTRGGADKVVTVYE